MDVISRRTMLVRAGLALAAASPLLRAAGAAAAPQPQVYKLVPSRTCKACTACKKHGHNRLFATAEAADEGRAHKGCRCRVRRTRKVSAEQRSAIFHPDGKDAGTAVDRRWPWVRTALRSAAR